MKKLALIMMFSVTSVVLSAEEYTIQTISAKKEASITPAFEKKVEKSALHSTKKKEGECNVVTVGHYKSIKEAHHDLKKAKAIAKDSFIRPLNRATPKACESRVASTSKTKTTEAKMSATPSKKEETTVMSHETLKTSVTTGVADSHATTATPSVNEVKNEPCKVQPCETAVSPVYVYDRNLVRKSDIHDAIEYYKNSPYHTFRPVLTQR